MTLATVAHHLQTEAVARRTNPVDRDLFGRSAYNRYYYATFLRVRQMFGRLDHKWINSVHAGYPDLLRGTIDSRLKRGAQAAARVGDYGLHLSCKSASGYARELARILDVGYATRTIADYNPDVLVIFDENERFSLNQVDITNAHNWPLIADTLSSSIEQAWLQINA